MSQQMQEQILYINTPRGENPKALQLAVRSEGQVGCRIEGGKTESVKYECSLLCRSSKTRNTGRGGLERGEPPCHQSNVNKAVV